MSEPTIGVVLSFDDPAWAEMTGAQRRAFRLSVAREKGRHTKQEWVVLHDVFKRCVLCDVPVSELYGGHATKDHIKPIMFGGCDCIANLQPVCRECNTKGIGVDLREATIPGWQTIYLHRLGSYY